MVDISLIQGAISSLKLAGDIAKGFLELKSISDVQGKVIELQSVILEAHSSTLAAYSAQSAMVEEIRALKEEIAKIKNWNTEKQRYKLTPQWKAGGIAYALKESMKNGEPAHLICTKCYEDGRKSILNPTKDSGGFIFYVCPLCKSQIPTGWRGCNGPTYAKD